MDRHFCLLETNSFNFDINNKSFRNWELFFFCIQILIFYIFENFITPLKSVMLF